MRRGPLSHVKSPYKPTALQGADVCSDAGDTGASFRLEMLLGVYDVKETQHRSKTAVPSPHVKRLPPQEAQSVVQLGLRANWQQFTLLVIVNAFVGGMVGLERGIVPLLGQHVFGLTSTIAVLSFIVSFGIVKAASNLFAGRLSDRIGRKGVLITGWLFGLPVPFLIIFAPAWGWVVFANVLLGINQGLCWSTTVIMKIDLVGPARRGLAMGINEAAGYGAVSLAAIAAGYLAATYALRPQPFLLGIGFALAGLLLSIFFVRETHGHARHEAALLARPSGQAAESAQQTTDQADSTTHSTIIQRDFPAHLLERSHALFCQSGRAGEQLERWPGVGAAAALLRGGRARYRADRTAGRDLPGRLGNHSIVHWCPLRPPWTQRHDRGRDDAPGGSHHLAPISPWLLSGGQLRWCCLGWALRSSIQRCSQPSRMWPTRSGAPRRWASTGSGAIADTP